MGILTFDGPDNTLLNLLETNQGVVRVKNSPPAAAAVVAPFYGAYYVDPDFTAVQTGSDSNPFTTVAAAFAFAAALGIANGIVYIAGKAIAENIVMPPTGNWELAGLGQWGIFYTFLNGTLDLSQTASTRRAFTNLGINGTITGNAPAGTGRVRFTNFTTNIMTLTASGAGTWRVTMGATPGWAGNSASAGPNGTTTINGELYGNNIALATINVSGAVWLQNSLGAGPLNSTAAGANIWRMFNCNMNAGIGINATTGSLTVFVDGITASQNFWGGLTIGANVQIVSANSNGSDRRTLANNLSLQTLYFDYPIALCTVQASLTTLVAGTLGNAILQVTYFDLLGVSQTKTVCGPLNIALAAGTEVVGTLQFSKQQATGVGWQVTGITTPGALSLSAAANLRIDR